MAEIIRESPLFRVGCPHMCASCRTVFRIESDADFEYETRTYYARVKCPTCEHMTNTSSSWGSAEIWLRVWDWLVRVSGAWI